MGLTVMLLAGAGIGLGLLIVVVSLRRPYPALVPTLARINRPTSLLKDEEPAERHVVLLSLGRAIGLERTVTESLRTDLRVIGRTADGHLVRCVITAVECGLVPPVLTIILAAGGIGYPIAVPAGLAVAGAVGGAVLPNITVHADAERRRRSFRHALGAYLDLISINLAAGRGVETALERAATSGHGWMFTEIRQALYRARVNPSNLLTSHNRRTPCSEAISC